MPEDRRQLVFGPVPSRRLGRSVGVNNVDSKTCSYSCAYCQVGRTAMTETVPRAFQTVEELVAAVGDRVRALRAREEHVDFVTFVADGEPTLDRHLGEELDGLRSLGIPLAVISNGSLLWREAVRHALARADWVSLKVDTVDESVWRRLNRPHGSLDLQAVLAGMKAFASGYRGALVTETMLVRGLNDGQDGCDATAAFLEQLQPQIAYVAAPTRPPAEEWVQPADENALNRCYQRFARTLPRVELLAEFEGTAFGTTGSAEEDLLGNAAVHPMREDAALALLAQAGADRLVLDRLVAEGRVRPVHYLGHTFYLRCLRPRAVRNAAGPRP
jgi:wyosine [tRNA(Phe)-imidazoG37] synthetase (radical SAM superfamily)